MANDELYTPKWIFNSLGVQFDLDVCAPIKGPLHTPTKAWFSELDDGLTKDWFGRIWMNPPYSKPQPWIDKWLDHKDGFALVPFSKSAWFIQLWNSPAKVVPLPVNVKFIDSNGKPAPIYFPTAIWAIGEINITALNMSDLGRIR